MVMYFKVHSLRWDICIMVKVLFPWKALAVNSLRAQPEAVDCSLQILSSALAVSRARNRSKIQVAHVCQCVNVCI